MTTWRCAPSPSSRSIEAELKALRKELKAKPSGDSAGSTRVAGQNEADLQRLDEGEEEEED